MQKGRSFFVVEYSIKSITKIYAKILSFVCIFWIIAAGWYYFVPYRNTMLYLSKITDRNIPRFIYHLESIKEALYQMRWLPIALLPCTIFLFHWISKRVKQKINAPTFVPEVNVKNARKI